MPRRFLHLAVAVALAWISWEGGTLASADEVGSRYDTAGPLLQVETLLDEWRDEARRRDVPVKIYHPRTGRGPFPVILFSHGLGGSREGYEYLGRHWAGRGYVSVHLQHQGSDASVWQGQVRPMEAMRLAVKDSRHALDRVADVRFALDRLDRVGRETSPLAGRIDMNRVGMAGHSFGAWTTLATIGQAAVGPGGRPLALPDRRVKAAVAMSAPVPGESRNLDQAFGGIRVPCMHMTGTLDDSPIGDTTAAQRRLPFDHIRGADQYLIVFQGGDHMVFSGRPRLRAAPADRDAAFQRLIAAASTAFWDAYLKDDAEARRFLVVGGLERLLADTAVFEQKRSGVAAEGDGAGRGALGRPGADGPQGDEGPTAARPPLPRIRVAGDGRTFVTERGEPFIPLGVNYYRPGTGWAPQVWKQFDADATRDDFAQMKALGVRCVRVFLSYGSFLTEPDGLSSEGLAKLDRFLAIAESEGIYVYPTGPDHWEGTPEWARADRVADERVLAALETFWSELAARYRGRTVLFAYDLRNEPEVAWDTAVMRRRWNAWLEARYATAEKTAEAWGVDPESIRWGDQPPPEPNDAPGDRRLLDYQHFREDVAAEWTRRQAAAIKAADPEALVSVGLIQWSVPALLPGVRHYSAFRPARQAELLDFLDVHFYPLDSGFYDYSTPEAEQRNLAYLECVVREVAAPGKPVLVGEFGWYGGGRLTINQGRHPPATEEQQSQWCLSLVRTTRRLATGWLNWGLYDQPEARDVSQLTGLLTSNGRTKTWGRDFRTLSAQLAGQAPPAGQIGPRPAMNWDALITSTAAGHKHRVEYLKAFVADEANPPR